MKQNDVFLFGCGRDGFPMIFTFMINHNYPDNPVNYKAKCFTKNLLRVMVKNKILQVT